MTDCFNCHKPIEDWQNICTKCFIEMIRLERNHQTKYVNHTDSGLKTFQDIFDEMISHLEREK